MWIAADLSLSLSLPSCCSKNNTELTVAWTDGTKMSMSSATSAMLVGRFFFTERIGSGIRREDVIHFLKLMDAPEAAELTLGRSLYDYTWRAGKRHIGASVRCNSNRLRY
jgi:hypothetical protein